MSLRFNAQHLRKHIPYAWGPFLSLRHASQRPTISGDNHHGKIDKKNYFGCISQLVKSNTPLFDAVFTSRFFSLVLCKFIPDYQLSHIGIYLTTGHNRTTSEFNRGFKEPIKPVRNYPMNCCQRISLHST